MKYNARHGGPYDRGSADSYYRRQFNPHYYEHGSYTGPRITDLTPDQEEAYREGYDDNEATGDHKVWN